MKTPDGKHIALTFHSHPERDLEMRWKAVVDFPPGSGPESVLSVRMEDGLGEKVKSAVFEFAGKRIAIKDGAGELTYADFVAGKHSVPVWVYRDGVKPVPGGLTFE